MSACTPPQGASGSNLCAIFVFLAHDVVCSIRDFTLDDGHKMSPKETWSYLGRVLYNRRSRIDPLWNQLICCGFEEGKR